jgi:hypothetical protein
MNYIRKYESYNQDQIDPDFFDDIIGNMLIVLYFKETNGIKRPVKITEDSFMEMLPNLRFNDVDIYSDEFTRSLSYPRQKKEKIKNIIKEKIKSRNIVFVLDKLINLSEDNNLKITFDRVGLPVPNGYAISISLNGQHFKRFANFFNKI